MKRRENIEECINFWTKTAEIERKSIRNHVVFAAGGLVTFGAGVLVTSSGDKAGLLLGSLGAGLAVASAKEASGELDHYIESIGNAVTYEEQLSQLDDTDSSTL